MKRFLLLVPLVLVACVSTPYIKATSESMYGYSDSQLGPNEYYVKYVTNSSSTQFAAYRLVEKRASEICNGSYTKLLPNPNRFEFWSCYAHSDRPCDDHLAQLWIKCGS